MSQLSRIRKIDASHGKAGCPAFCQLKPFSGTHLGINPISFVEAFVRNQACVIALTHLTIPIESSNGVPGVFQSGLKPEGGQIHLPGNFNIAR